MNEFIVWDNVEKKFVCDNNNTGKAYFISVDGRVIKKKIGLDIFGGSIELEWEINRLKAFPYIGKTDIVGNKIYADSSIVELVDSGSRGIFFFDEKYLKFKFAFNGDIITSLGIESFEKTAQFKIIGTLQENQELLGVNK